ncbi:MAG: hypothetical protein II007_09440 [Gammaproteobacteria bacterium]|nr:hypothetical protein [Gammaproteobacteria bacterium]
MHKQFRLPLLLALLVMISGCSLRLTYGFLDWWLLWQVEDYVTLDSGQQQQLEQALQQFHQWHRQHELPRYAALAEETAQILAAPRISVAQLQQIEDEASTLWQASVDRLLPAGIRVLASLSDEQVSELAESLALARAEFAEEYVAPSATERLQNRAARLVETLEPLVGELNDQQQQQASEAVRRLQESASLALAHREQEHARFLALLAGRQQPGFASALTAFVHDYELRRPQPLQQVYDHNGAIVHQLVIDLHVNLTRKQRRHLDRYLREHQDIFLELARSA